METVIAFENTHSAMVAQRLLHGEVPFVVMPTPRQISASCGIALKIAAEHGPTAQALLRQTIPDTFHVYEGLL